MDPLLVQFRCCLHCGSRRNHRRICEYPRYTDEVIDANVGDRRYQCWPICHLWSPENESSIGYVCEHETAKEAV